MMPSAAVLGLMLAAAAPACTADGTALTGRFEWQSLTRPNGKPIPAPYALLDIPICIRTAQGVVLTSGLLRLFPRDEAVLQGLHTGDNLIVIGRYREPDDFKVNGDIGAYDVQIVRQ
jgi:hypothetical protein